MTFFFQKTVDCSKLTTRCEQLSFTDARDCSKITPVQKAQTVAKTALFDRARDCSEIEPKTGHGVRSNLRARVFSASEQGTYTADAARRLESQLGALYGADCERLLLGDGGV